MASVKYVGPYHSVEVPHLNWQRFDNGVAVDVPDDQLGNFHEQDCWEIDGTTGASPAAAVEEPVHTTGPDNQPPVPDPEQPAPAPSAPAEGN